jgi:hypothetical protein
MSDIAIYVTLKLRDINMIIYTSGAFSKARFFSDYSE